MEAVPTGIRTHAGQLLVTLFRGFPFPAGTSSVEQVDPSTGSRTALIDGLKAAIDVLAVGSGTVEASHDCLVLQHASSPVLFAAPRTLARIDLGTGAAAVIADCLNRPTSMARDATTGSPGGSSSCDEGTTGSSAAVASARFARRHPLP